MTLLEQVSALRRRWLYLLVGLVVGAIAGYVTAPGDSGRPTQFEATHTLLLEGEEGGAAGLNVDQTALLVTGGAVSERVADRLETEGIPRFDELEARADSDVFSVAIRAISPTPEGAERAADLAAEEVVAELAATGLADLEDARVQAQERVDQLTAALSDIEARLSPLGPEDPGRASLEVERDSTLSALTAARQDVDELSSTSAPSPGVRTLRPALAKPYHGDGLQLPDDKAVRAVLLSLFGLLLGVVGALAAEQLDTRVRNKEDAELAFDLPVVAEVPPLPAGARRRELLVATRPAAPFVEAFRTLRSVVLFAAEHGPAAVPASGFQRITAESSRPGPNGTSGHDERPSARSAQVILVTSPSAGEGKTTSAAHLAAVLAEFGKTVLVISADFRRPRIHELFDVKREPGLSDVLRSSGGGVRLSDIQLTTSFDGVKLLPSGSPVSNPAQLLTETSDLINAARTLFDFVIVDTPPLLVANDAVELAPTVDMILLVAKADRTSADAARRSTEMLRRIDAPLLGVVVAAAHDTPTAYGYYRYRYYAWSDQGADGRWTLRRGRSRRPADTMTAAAATKSSDRR